MSSRGVARSSSVQEIAHRLIAEFEDLPDGAKLPGEHRLAEKYSVTRSHFRSVMDVLVERHVVRRVHGAGTYINRPLDFTISSGFPPSFHAAVEAQGRVAKTLLVDFAETCPPEDVAASLGCDSGRPVTKLTRLGLIDDRVARCAHEWILPEVVSEVATALGAVESLHEVLRMGRHLPERGRTIVSSEYPPGEIEQMLELPKPVATWVIETLTRDGDSGDALMVSRTWCRQDAMRLVVEW